jgi:PAP2 superfamily
VALVSRPDADRSARAARLWDWLSEVLYLAAAYALYAWIRGRVGAATDRRDLGRATRNGERIVRIERVLGLYRERQAQRWVLHWSWLVRALDTFWSFGYLVVTIIVFVWLLARHRDHFQLLRTAFFLATFPALVVFALWPTVPPRLLPASYGLVDTWTRVGGIDASRPPRIEHISDPFAAMPSLHVAWAVWCAAAATIVLRRRALRWLVWLYPLLTTFTVIATGNHYVLDCLAGTLLMVVALRWSPRFLQLLQRAGPPRRSARSRWSQTSR